MGIQVSAPVQVPDTTFVGTITGFKRLWGGTSYISNQLIKLGATNAQLSNLWANVAPKFFKETYFGGWTSGYIGYLVSSLTGLVAAYSSAPPSSLSGGVTEDILARYPPLSQAIQSPETLTATSSVFEVTDYITGKTMYLPVASSDVAGINGVLSNANSSYFALLFRAFSLYAQFVVVGAIWGNGISSWGECMVMFQTEQGTLM